MKISKKFISVILSLVLIFLTTFTTGYAENKLFSSFNIQNYSNTRYASIVYSQLHTEDNKLSRAEIDENVVHIEMFDKNYNLTSSLKINGELEYICGVYFGANNNFIVCAQNNPEESDSKEVVRIIKYSKAWQRISNASIYGANTYIFADAGSLRFAEYGNYLYIRSCHEMYMTSDGLHHQANMTFVVNTSTMEVTDNNYAISNNSTGYVSHSFNQFIATDTDTNSVIAVDHGDAIPRSIIMFRYTNKLGSSALTSPEKVTIFDIAGISGDNVTEVCVSDLIVTNNNYIVAFNTTPQDGVSVTRNAYLAIVPKNSFRTASVKLVKLTDYSGKDNVVCGYPYITDIGNGKYSVIWEANKSTDTKNNVYYTTVDENGNKLTQIKSFEAYLSDCEPIYTDGKVIWYSTFNSEPVFYYVSTSGAGVECDKYESVNNKFESAEWNYSQYFSDDNEIILTVNRTAGSNVTSLNVSSDTNIIGYSLSDSVIRISTYNTAGTYYLYATFSNGKIIKKSIVVKDVSEKNTDTDKTCTHSYRKDIEQQANCIQDGIIKYTCVYCKDTYKDIIPAGKHENNNYDGFCDGCYRIMITENPTAYIVWDKDTYYTDSQFATLNVVCDEGVSITDIYSSDSGYSYRLNSETSLSYWYFGKTGTTTVYLRLSDGQIICSDLVVKEKQSSTPETTTKIPETTTMAPETTTKAPETTTTPALTAKKGDVNKDGKITASDARTVLRISARLETASPEVLLIADVNNSGDISASDARKILRVSAFLESFD